MITPSCTFIIMSLSPSYAGPHIKCLPIVAPLTLSNIGMYPAQRVHLWNYSCPTEMYENPTTATYINSNSLYLCSLLAEGIVQIVSRHYNVDRLCWIRGGGHFPASFFSQHACEQYLSNSFTLVSSLPGSWLPSGFEDKT